MRNTLWALITIVLLASCSYGIALNQVTNATEEKKQGNESLKKGDYQGYLYWYKRAAQMGDIDAQVTVGDYYYANRNNPNGVGGDQGAQASLRADYYEAEEWYQRAAEQGSTEAMIKLATMYTAGEVTGENKQDAILLYKKALSLGDKKATLGLAKLEPVLVRAKKYSEQIPGALVCSNTALLSSALGQGLVATPAPNNHSNPENIHYPGCAFFKTGVEIVVSGDLENGKIAVRLGDGNQMNGSTLPEMIEH